MQTGVTKRRLVGLLGVATMFVAACGSSNNTTGGGGGNATPAPAESQDPNAVAGGTLNLGVWQEPTSFLDAGIVDSLTFSYLIDAPVQEGLLWYRSATQTSSAKSLADYWAPDLATEVPTTDNGDVKTSGCSNAQAKMCVTWKLRSGVKWHDGSAFGPHDVCDTFQFFFLKYGNNNPTALLSTSGWDQVVGCTENASSNSVTVDYKSTYGPYLALGSGVYGILPASILDQAFKNNSDLEKLNVNVDLSQGSGNSDAYKGSSTSLDGILDGTGPYVFASYTPTKEIVLVQNKNYWNTAHMPHIAKLVFKMEADLTSEVNAAKAGDVDMAFDMRLYNLSGLDTAAKAANAKFKVQTIEDSGAEKIDMNLCAGDGTLCDNPAAKKNPYTADLTIRQAILKGINRQNIIDNQADGKTVIPKDSWMYLGAEWIDDPNIQVTGYDQAGANSMLDQAGYARDAKCGTAPDGQNYRKFKDGSCIVINVGTTSNNPSRVATESLVQGDLAKIGINVPSPFTPNLKPGAFFGTFSDGGPLYTHAFDMAMYTNTLSAPAEPDAYYAGYHGNCGGQCTSDKGKNQIPSAANGGNGQDDTGINDPTLDTALENARYAVNLSDRAKFYMQAEEILAKQLPEIPLYQQVTVDSYTTKLNGLRDNDLVWDFNSYDWWCTGGNCQA